MGPNPGDSGARRRLTASRIAAVRSAARTYDYTDRECPGLLLHVAARLADGSEGTRSWHWRFYWRGKRAKLTVGQYPATGIAAAHDVVRRAREAIERGIDPRKAGLTRARHALLPATPHSEGRPDDEHSINALVTEFVARFIAPNRKHPEEVERILLKEVVAAWQGRDARAIKPRDVIDLLDGIVDRGSPVMANRVAALLKQLFKYGVHRQIVETSPVQLLYAPGGVERPRSRALTDAELAALLSHADTVMSRAPRTVAAIRVILHTACRRGEIALARWSHFDMDGVAPIWRVPPELSKTGDEYFIPLVPAVIETLRNLKRRSGRSPWVFPNGSADQPGDPKILTRSLSRHLKAFAAKKIKPFTLHDLRRTVRTGLARLKVAPHIAERVLNHAQPGIVAAYDVHAYLDEKREALQRWADHLSSLKCLGPHPVR